MMPEMYSEGQCILLPLGDATYYKQMKILQYFELRMLHAVEVYNHPQAHIIINQARLGPDKRVAVMLINN